MRSWIIAIASVAALVALTLGALYYVGGTPQYSLYLLRNAVREGDRDTFDHHFDVAKVVTNVVERAVGGVRAGPQIVSQKATDEIIPAADKLIRERIDERFDDPSAAPVLDMGIDSVRYQNNAAFVTLKGSDGATTTLTLERMRDRHWKVVDLDLAKANVQFSLAEARQKAEELLPPEMPKVTKPDLGIPEKPF